MAGAGVLCGSLGAPPATQQQPEYFGNNGPYWVLIVYHPAPAPVAEQHATDSSVHPSHAHSKWHTHVLRQNNGQQVAEGARTRHADSRTCNCCAVATCRGPGMMVRWLTKRSPGNSSTSVGRPCTTGMQGREGEIGPCMAPELRARIILKRPGGRCHCSLLLWEGQLGHRGTA